MTYRADIQILRAIAVIAVVLFHLETGFFKLGFLGVDIFFVISGFFMAILIENVSAYDFYKKRIQRLLPAYYAVILCVMAVSIFAVLPLENYAILKSALYAFFFIPNIGEWTLDVYFSNKMFRPLLHLWSLGVEIQFYLFVPLIYYIEKRLKHSILILFFLSLCTCFVLTTISTNAAFFFMPMRAWEFLMGWLVARNMPLFATLFKTHTQKNYAFMACITSIIMMCLSMPLESKSIIYGHPGLIALIICLLTALMIGFGLPHYIEKSIIGRALTVIGNYSYSIYIVHFPIIVFYYYVPFQGIQFNSAFLPYIVIAICVFTFLSYHFIETKMRASFSIKNLLIICTLFIALYFGTHLFIKNSYSPAQLKIALANFNKVPFRCGTLFKIIHFNKNVCEVKPERPIKKHNGNILLVGDSHSDAIKKSFVKVASHYGYNTFIPVVNGPLRNNTYNQEWLIKEVIALNAKAVFIHYSIEVDLEKITTGLKEKLEKIGTKLIFLSQVPKYKIHVPYQLYYNIDGNDKNYAQYLKDNKKNFSYMKKQATQGAYLYNLGKIFCNPECIKINANDTPLYWDQGHVTYTGAALLEPLFHNIFKKKPFI